MKKQILISLIFFSSALITSAQTYDTGDKVGIGRTNPLVKLDVYSRVYALPSTSGIVQPGATLRLQGADNGILDFGESNDGFGTFWIQATDITSLNQKYKLLLNPNGGNIGVGTTNPQSQFHIGGSTTSQLSLGNISYGGNSGQAIGAIQAVQGNSDGGILNFQVNPWNQNGNTGIYTPITRMTITQFGNVGIGTTEPLVKLNVYSKNYALPATSGTNQSGGILRLRGADNGILDFGESNDGTGTFWIQATDIGSLAQSYKLLINPNGGNVLIGKINQVNNSYKLDVAGKIRADEIVVNTSGADFVFNSQYKLPSLSEVEEFIKQNNHLPDIKPAAEMQTNGISISEMQTKLLQKIEELTLYTIEQNKKIEALESEMKKMKTTSM